VAISPNDLSLRQLQYAVAVADTLGFHKAAERCHVSQPTLSAQIKQLEEVLGIELFERDRRRVLVTEAGEAVLERARRVLVAMDDLVGAAEKIARPGAVTLRVGVIPTVAPYFLPEVLPAVRKLMPDVRLVFREDKTEAVVGELREGRLDAGLLALEADIGKWAFARILTDDFVVALPKDHPLSKKKRLVPGDLDGEHVLLLEDGHCFRTQALAVCDRAGATESELRATSLATLTQMVSGGMGITLLPKIAVPVENRAGQLEIRRFASPAPHRTLALIWRPQSPFAETLRALAASFETAAKRIPA
jgi:LysR family hydrogen peroxide-inducible transcriptional activator